MDNQNDACIDSSSTEYENEVSLFPLINFAWCMNLTSLTIIMQESLNDVISSHVNIKDTEDNFRGSDNKEENAVKKKPDRKPIIGSLSRDTFLSLSHTLRTHSPLIKCLLLDKKFECALPGHMSNDRIERHFGLMRFLSGMHMALDMISFCQNERAHSLWTMSELCKNKDGSHSKSLWNSFFKEAQKLTDSCEKIEVDELFINSQKLSALKCYDILECEKSDVVPHT